MPDRVRVVYHDRKPLREGTDDGFLTPFRVKPGSNTTRPPTPSPTSGSRRR